MRAEMRNLALLKNARVVGADGLLARAVLNSVHKWSVIALKRDPGDELPTGQTKPQMIEAYTRWNSIVSRLRPILAVALVLLKIKRTTANGDLRCIVAGSAELAAIASLLGLKANSKFYLFSDLTVYHLSRKTAWMVVAIERYCARRGWIPVVTSPAFYSEYLGKVEGGASRAILVHNVPTEIIDVQATEKSFGEKVTIAWFGLIRCKASAELLLDVLPKSSYKLKMAGESRWIEPSLIDGLRATGFFVHHGPYCGADLSSLYAGVDFTWCCDWSLGENSKYLIPNRLYQGLLAGTAVIASRGSFLEKVVKAYDIGFSISAAAELLRPICESNLARWKANAARLGARLERDGGWADILEGRGAQIGSSMSAGYIFQE